jgi:hypothetical protein
MPNILQGKGYKKPAYVVAYWDFSGMPLPEIKPNSNRFNQVIKPDHEQGTKQSLHKNRAFKLM